jgi:DNA-binding NtrC family response regulator
MYHDYDLLITDNDLPALSGVDLLKRLHAACFILPVIMATGNYPQEEFIRHPHLPPATMLLKPYTAAALVTVVDGILSATRKVNERLPIWELQMLNDRLRP